MAPRDENDVLNQNNDESNKSQRNNSAAGGPSSKEESNKDGFLNRFKSSFGNLKNDFNQAMREINEESSGMKSVDEFEKRGENDYSQNKEVQETVKINYEDEDSEYIPQSVSQAKTFQEPANPQNVRYAASEEYLKNFNENKGSNINTENKDRDIEEDNNIYSKSRQIQETPDSYVPGSNTQKSQYSQETPDSYVPRSSASVPSPGNTGGYYQESAGAPYDDYVSSGMNSNNTFNMSFVYPQVNAGSNILGESTIIGKNTTVKGEIIAGDPVNVQGQLLGDIECKSDVLVSGKVRGNTVAQNVNLVGAEVAGEVKCIDMIKVEENSWLLGDIKGTEVLIHGKVKGDIDTRRSVSIDTKAVVMGDINTEEIEIKRGAYFNGHIEMYHPSLEIIDRFNEFSEGIG